MGFVRTIAKIGSAATSPFGLAALALGNKKKKKPSLVSGESNPMMTLTNRPVDRPTSMITGRY